MKRTLWLIMVLLIGVVGCNNEWNNREYSFAQGFADLKALDEEYNASFKEERLGKISISLENVDPFLKALAVIESNIEDTKDNRDKEALLVFISIRKGMILAEKNYQLAKEIGNIGLVEDEGGFTCGESRYILDTAYLFNESFSTAKQVIYLLDDLLYHYRDVEQLQELVGLDENKTQFYLSPLDDMSKTIKLNYVALEKNCKIRVVTKEEKDL